MSVATCQCGGSNQWAWTVNRRSFTCTTCGRGNFQECVGLGTGPQDTVPLVARQALADVQWAAQVAAWARPIAVGNQKGAAHGPQ